MQLRTLFTAGAFAAALVGTPLTAQTVSFLPGTSYAATALTGYSTTGSMMVGMEVFWTFASGGEGSGTWGSLGAGTYYGVTGTNFSLRIGGGTDTFGNSWRLWGGEEIASVTLRGALGYTVFDCTWYRDDCYDHAGNPGGDGDGTENSARGWNGERTGGYAGPVQFIYSNMVGVGGNSPLGDIFERVDILFADGMKGKYKFILDTDNSEFSDDPPSSTVPEPASMVLVATGLLGLAAAHRRRRKQS